MAQAAWECGDHPDRVWRHEVCEALRAEGLVVVGDWGAAPSDMLRVYDVPGGAFGLEGPLPMPGAPLGDWARSVAARARSAVNLRR